MVKLFFWISSISFVYTGSFIDFESHSFGSFSDSSTYVSPTWPTVYGMKALTAKKGQTHMNKIPKIYETWTAPA